MSEKNLSDAISELLKENGYGGLCNQKHNCTCPVESIGEECDGIHLTCKPFKAFDYPCVQTIIRTYMENNNVDLLSIAYDGSGGDARNCQCDITNIMHKAKEEDWSCDPDCSFHKSASDEEVRNA